MDHRIPVVITERRESGITSDPCVANNAVPCAVCLNILQQYFTALLAKTVRGQLSGDGATDTFAGTRN